jgi:Transcriptional regulator
LPTSTFFNLPEEKRQKLIAAALEEFSTVPFAEASINKIIRRAGIPRGSFYMYFEDKRELFLYLIRNFVGQTVGFITDCLVDAKGDVFAGFLLLYDRLDIFQASQPFPIHNIIHLNKGLHTGDLFKEFTMNDVFQRLIEHVDTSLLRAESDEDVQEISELLFQLVAPSIFRASLCPAAEAEAQRERFVNRLKILQRGMRAE